MYTVRETMFRAAMLSNNVFNYLLVYRAVFTNNTDINAE